VVLPSGYTGSSLFHAMLKQAVAEFPGALTAAELPSQASVFKRDYGTILPRFEAARVGSPERVQIARFILNKTQSTLEFVNGHGREPLSEHLARPTEPPVLEQQVVGAEPTLKVEVPLDGTIYRGREVLALVDRLAEEQVLTNAARDALRWVVQHIEDAGGTLDLRGHSFAVLGAGAELASTRMLLAAGARVLWIDLADPGVLLAQAPGLSGTLVHAPGANNLLEAPERVAAAIERFAAEGDGTVHLGMFAYASGASQEWRLGAAMNAIAAHLSPTIVRSIALLVSPTSTATVQPECLAAAAAQLARGSRWKSALRHAGLLSSPGQHVGHGVHIARATVSIQGLSYQAAQYISKLLAAESYAVYGTQAQTDPSVPVTVSANVAGITRTRSLAHPLFQAAFIGARHFGVRIFDPSTTRALSGLLILHDLLNPSAPGAASVCPGQPGRKASGLLSQQVHGGIYSLPYVLEHAIRIAALIGMGRKPSVFLGGKSRAATSAIQA